MQSARSLAIAMIILGLCSPAPAQEFPSKPVKIIVPYPAGGSADVVARVSGQQLSGILGQQFIIENRSGAGGISAVDALVKSPADGYTLLMADAGHWAINPALYSKLPYDPLKDLAPVGMATTSSLFLVVHESFPAKDLKELIALVKSRPGEFNYGSSGNGSLHHLTMEAFKAAFALDIVHVPFKGTGQSIPALVGGQVPMAIAAITSVAPHAKAGRVKILGANTKKRSPLAMDVPTMGEAGTTDFDYPGEEGLVAPAGTPRAVIEKLSAALNKAVHHPEAVARFTAIALEPVGGSPEQLAATIRADIPKYARVVKISGAKVD